MEGASTVKRNENELGLVDELLMEGTIDWVYIGQVIGVASDVASIREDVRAVSLGLVAELLLQGLMEAGDVTGDGFVPWDVEPQDATRRILGELSVLKDTEVLPGAIAWLRNTQIGEDRGMAARARFRANRV